MKYLILTIGVLVVTSSCNSTSADEETNECIKALEEKGHSHEEAKDMCEAGEALETVK